MKKDYVAIINSSEESTNYHTLNYQPKHLSGYFKTISKVYARDGYETNTN